MLGISSGRVIKFHPSQQESLMRIGPAMTILQHIEMATTPSFNIPPRRTITLQVDEVVRGQGVQTSEFELPDADVVF
jgi:hypothetical protein